MQAERRLFEWEERWVRRGFLRRQNASSDMTLNGSQAVDLFMTLSGIGQLCGDCSFDYPRSPGAEVVPLWSKQG